MRTFHRPKHNQALIRVLTYVNRTLNLKGLPWLKWLPIINRWPIVRGLCDVTAIDFSLFDEAKIRQIVKPENAVFIGPNHPEFYTDWMLDKEISARCAPMMASWATHTIVNGMGGWMREFWLSNGLIAQIPGNNDDAKAFSVEHALKGHGVLLHPEGKVEWHSNTMGPIYNGIIDMAYQAKEIAPDKNVYIAPVVWKLYYNVKALHALHRSFDDIETQLDITSSVNRPLEDRLYHVLDAIMCQRANQCGLFLNGTIREKHAMLLEHLRHAIGVTLNMPNATVKEMYHHTCTLLPSDRHSEANVLIQEYDNFAKWRFDYYNKDMLTYEEVGEWQQVIRVSMLHKGWKNLFHKFIPRPVVSRTACIRVPDPIEVDLKVPKEEVKTMMVTRMQNALDGINDDLERFERIHYVKNTLKD